MSVVVPAFGAAIERIEGMWASKEEDDGTSESSSIGAPGESSISSEGDPSPGAGDDEAESKLKNGSLSSLSSLDESLPIKRGLSNFFSGKSKSFACLTAMPIASAEELAKPENPFNKRRRILMATKSSWRRRASCSSFNTSLPTLLLAEHAVEEEDDDGRPSGRVKPGVQEEEEEDDDDVDYFTFPLPPLPKQDGKAFRAPRSFSLSDLRHA